jgi:hypothetical protein
MRLAEGIPEWCAREEREILDSLLADDPLWRPFLAPPEPAPFLANPTSKLRILAYLAEQAHRGWERGRDVDDYPAVFASDGVDDWGHRRRWWEEHGDLDAIRSLHDDGLIVPGWGRHREDPWHITPHGHEWLLSVTGPTPSLTLTERLVEEFLLGFLPHVLVGTPDIVEHLYAEHSIDIEASNLRTRVIPKLKRRGLVAEGRRGYRYPETARARQEMRV